MNTPRQDLVNALRGGRLAITVILVIALVGVLGRALTSFYVEVLWQAQAGYLSVFWRRVIWESGVRVFGGVVVGILVFYNLKVASTTLGGIQIRRRFGNLEISEQLPKRYVLWAMLTAAAFLGLWFGASLPAGLGRQALHAVSSAGWGLRDPVLGQDVGFYVFWLPVLDAGISYALITGFLIFTLTVAGYAATGAMTWRSGRLQAHELARRHLGVLLAAFFVLLAVRMYLSRYGLLITGNSAVQGIFGFTDAEARLPALQTLTIVTLGAAGATVWGAWRNRPLFLIGSFVAVIGGMVLIGNIYPSVIQSFRVEPNELERETPFIEHNLEYTRLAYGLDAASLERRPFAFDANAPIDWGEAAEQFAGLPVWGSGVSAPLLTTYREVEARFQYYDFDRVAVDRYPTEQGLTPVTISVRQVDPTGIPDPNWQNLHLRERYVAGVGVVASVANSRTAEGRPEMLVRGLPPETLPSSVGSVPLDLDRPEVFFGTGTDRGREYVVVTPGPDQFQAPDGTVGVAGVDFPEGIQISSTLKTLLLAWRFQAANLLFASELTDDSRLVHRRRVTDRVLAVAPFLRFPEAPYPVVTEGRVVWVLEGFTGTLAFPLSKVYDFGAIRQLVRYVRNSVKVTVDAVTGEMIFYRVPIGDPIADAFDSAYPGLFRNIEEMPSELRGHLRYPRSLLELQSSVLLQYHQETAAEFHGQQDVWVEAEELSNTSNPVPYVPEYGMYRLPEEEEARFQLTNVFVPAGRENLTAMLVARTDDLGVPETILMDVPVDDEVLGPRLIEARLEQDPVISQQFSLWRTGGSEVWTGHLHLVPVGNRLLYMEPVFLAAEEDAIPDLARFVVSDGVRVVMAESLAEAIAQMAGLPFTPEIESGEAGAAAPEPGSVGPWPTAALALLERAEERARAGDWAGFGIALAELRALLERLDIGGL